MEVLSFHWSAKLKEPKPGAHDFCYYISQAHQRMKAELRDGKSLIPDAGDDGAGMLDPALPE